MNGCRDCKLLDHGLLRLFDDRRPIREAGPTPDLIALRIGSPEFGSPPKLHNSGLNRVNEQDDQAGARPPPYLSPLSTGVTDYSGQE